MALICFGRAVLARLSFSSRGISAALQSLTAGRMIQKPGLCSYFQR